LARVLVQVRAAEARRRTIDEEVAERNDGERRSERADLIREAMGR
jgi:hypothetical protein